MELSKFFAETCRFMMTAATMLADRYSESSSAVVELTDCVIRKMKYVSQILFSDLLEDRLWLYGIDLKDS